MYMETEFWGLQAENEVLRTEMLELRQKPARLGDLMSSFHRQMESRGNEENREEWNEFFLELNSCVARYADTEAGRVQQENEELKREVAALQRALSETVSDRDRILEETARKAEDLLGQIFDVHIEQERRQEGENSAAQSVQDLTEEEFRDLKERTEITEDEVRELRKQELITEADERRLLSPDGVGVQETMEQRLARLEAHNAELVQACLQQVPAKALEYLEPEPEPIERVALTQGMEWLEDLSRIGRSELRGRNPSQRRYRLCFQRFCYMLYCLGGQC
jgi:hypothetical protein